jgi:hypothetical protein
MFCGVVTRAEAAGLVVGVVAVVAVLDVVVSVAEVVLAFFLFSCPPQETRPQSTTASKGIAVKKLRFIVENLIVKE